MCFCCFIVASLCLRGGSSLFLPPLRQPLRALCPPGNALMTHTHPYTSIHITTHTHTYRHKYTHTHTTRHIYINTLYFPSRQWLLTPSSLPPSPRAPLPPSFRSSLTSAETLKWKGRSYPDRPEVEAWKLRGRSQLALYNTSSRRWKG